MWWSRFGSERAAARAALAAVAAAACTLVAGCFDPLVDRSSCLADRDCFAGEVCFDGQCHVGASDARADTLATCEVCVHVVDDATGEELALPTVCSISNGESRGRQGPGELCVPLPAVVGAQLGVAAPLHHGVTVFMDLSGCTDRFDAVEQRLTPCNSATETCANPCGAQ